MPKKDDKLPYTLGKWKGIDQYLCKFCQFDTLHKDVALEHYDKVHAPPPPKPPLPSLIPVYDRFGNPVPFPTTLPATGKDAE